MPVTQQNSLTASDPARVTADAAVAPGAREAESDNKPEAVVSRRQSSDGHLGEDEPDDEAGTV